MAGASDQGVGRRRIGCRIPVQMASGVRRDLSTTCATLVQLVQVLTLCYSLGSPHFHHDKEWDPGGNSFISCTNYTNPPWSFSILVGTTRYAHPTWCNVLHQG